MKKKKNIMKRYLPLFEVVTGIALGFLIVGVFFKDAKQFENFDLGAETVPFFAYHDTFPIHLSNAGMDEFDKLLEGWKLRGENDVILVLGNSQTHSVNQLKAGEANYPQILHDRFSLAQVDVLTHSIPNANLQELYLLFAFWTSKLPIKRVLLPVFVDDLREDGIREVYSRLAIENRFTIPEKDAVANEINRRISSYHNIQATQQAGTDDMKALRETVQEKSESYLNGKLQASFSHWNYRETVRGDFFTFLYKLRNTVLNISPNTKRKLIPHLRDKNLAALRALCQGAVERGIEVLIYVPPVRYDVDPPYFEEEYESAIDQVATISKNCSTCSFKRLDRIVPGQFWGTKDATAFFRDREYDFMHFQYQGHVILADSLMEFLNAMR